MPYSTIPHDYCDFWIDEYNQIYTDIPELEKWEQDQQENKKEEK